MTGHAKSCSCIMEKSDFSLNIPAVCIHVTLMPFLFCSMSFGGSLIRPEATGYGLIYFVEVRTLKYQLG